MGYQASYCEICGGPTNLVVDEPEEGPAFEPRPEHGWLARIAGLLPRSEVRTIQVENDVAEPRFFVLGRMDDHGVLTTVDGLHLSAGWCGGYRAVHAQCWELAGRPTAEALDAFPGPPPEMAPYQQQYFDWARLAADGHEWMLDPPQGGRPGSERNRARIEARGALLQ